MFLYYTFFAIFMVIIPSLSTHAHASVQGKEDFPSSLHTRLARAYPPLGSKSLDKFRRDSPKVNGSILLDNHRPNGDSTLDVYYTLGAKVGNGSAHLVIDTRTADLVIDKEIYGKSTGVPYANGFTFAVTYSNGWDFSGATIFRDTVGLYPSFKDSLSPGQKYTFLAHNQTVEVADIKSSTQLGNLPNPQGVIGLGFNLSSGVKDFHNTSGNFPEPHSIVETLEPTLKDRVVGLALQRWGPPGMDIGWWDPSRMDGQICWTGSFYGPQAWMVHVQSILLAKNGSQFGDASYSAVLDSKYPGILLPLDIANAYFALVPGSSQNVYPCRTRLPSLTVILQKGCAISIPGEALKRLDLGGGKCMMAVESSGSNSNHVTLGIPFFNIMYTVLDYPNYMVGVGQHAGLQDTLDQLELWETQSPRGPPAPTSTPPKPTSAASSAAVPSLSPTPSTKPTPQATTINTTATHT